MANPKGKKRKKGKNNKNKKKARENYTPSPSREKPSPPEAETREEADAIEETYYKNWIEVEGLWFELKIHDEKRVTCRVSIRPHSINVRLPVHLSAEERDAEIKNVWTVVQEKVTKNWDYYSRYAPPKHYDGQMVEVYPLEARLNIIRQALEADRIELTAGQLFVFVDSRKKEGLVDHSISRLIADLFAKTHRPVAEMWVHDLNQAHFKQQVGRVTLRNNMTRWGSCSKKGNISLAVSLLLAPQKIRDYVIIHELAHLSEPNHSSGFWRLLEQVDPNYREHEAWLQKNGHTLKF